jgi:hypothetical protein
MEPKIKNEKLKFSRSDDKGKIINHVCPINLEVIFIFQDLHVWYEKLHLELIVEFSYTPLLIYT